MQKITLLAVFSIMVSVASGRVMTTVYRADGNTPLELADSNIPFVYRDIMVGTKLTIVVSSEANEYWGDGFGNDGGSLSIEEDYWDYGVLSARDPQVGDDWSGSHFPAAGEEATVYDWEESDIDGFDLYTGSTEIETGNWFVIDYTATEAGTCKIGFYDHTISWDDPNYYLTFSHVQTRDFDGDTKVNMSDFSVLASYWQVTDCNEPDWCEGADLDFSGSVDLNDLRLFVEFWLERTE